MPLHDTFFSLSFFFSFSFPSFLFSFFFFFEGEPVWPSGSILIRLSFLLNFVVYEHLCDFALHN